MGACGQTWPVIPAYAVSLRHNVLIRGTGMVMLRRPTIATILVYPPRATALVSCLWDMNVILESAASRRLTVKAMVIVVLVMDKHVLPNTV
ncbi:MAG: hypothetical protein A3E37_04120 [Candidatus Andersenbacteria bacterium RIFCSPHIGHO2_12_FULL_46_9]|nr:MAG: hypothetical protein A3B76_00695 [Candidatus Andersenbacteria bacterium RIFCSPHIGHO2_02_FULL_46_16]OGY37431.1 MAG: hypothetical protein A3I08_00100 [Candidatus Andersenbacteria bacterium RIFCSPLOWO2_02_FULL_46_11]OGY37949.1 MAG: hypothetical protein A3E37_04120 [Candidatus Andersenbacteria bacterium RIFCSPHIGHO2_12_FULL_46_9]